MRISSRRDIFELIYRDAIRLPLLVHHLLTVFAIVWVVFCLEAGQHPSLIATAEIWLFQATLEQVVFLGLLSCQSLPPRFSANQLKVRPLTVALNYHEPMPWPGCCLIPRMQSIRCYLAACDMGNQTIDL